MKPKILGLSASLRNARRGKGNQSLIEDINSITTQEQLQTYLESQASFHLENFLEAGRKEKLPFDKMYTNLKKQRGDKGLSNSEIALAAALWSCKELNSDIDHLSLSEYFMENSKRKNIEELRDKLIKADGILLSAPVYFGDRGSLSQSLVNYIRQDKDLENKLKNKIYAGIAVGAKRNGGQETTLIYQLLDMLNIGFLGVGNDSETTSQYGGTGLAGDVGTMQKDKYGLDTSMGTGRRIARVASMMNMAKEKELVNKHKILFWVLQDKNDTALNYIQNLLSPFHDTIEAKIINIASKNVIRCLACDICPTSVDLDEVYRCIIKNPTDDLSEIHLDLLDADAIIPVCYSAVDKQGVISNYQRFIERTRYLRRGDYVFSDVLTAPLVIEELGANENMHIRMITSMIRHHTITSNPIIAYQSNGQILNHSSVLEKFENLNFQIREVTKARLLAYSSNVNHLKYKPVGYILSSEKDKEDEKLLRRSQMIEARVNRSKEMLKDRIRKTI